MILSHLPADNVHQFDASRQTTRISANVAGIFGSAAVRLNDNLLIAFTLIVLVGFLAVRWGMARPLATYGERLGLRDVSDVASLPLVAAVFSVDMTAATPLWSARPCRQVSCVRAA